MQFCGNTFINKHLFLSLTITSSVICYKNGGKKRSGKTPSSLPPILLLELFTSQILVLNNNGTNNSLMLKHTDACSVNVIVPHIIFHGKGSLIQKILVYFFWQFP